MSQARLFYWKVATFLGATNHDEEPRRPKCLAPWPLLLKRPDVQRYPDDTRRAPAKPPAQPVGIAESDMNKSSWQKPACTHSAHRRRCVLELGPQIPQQRCVCGQAVPRFTSAGRPCQGSPGWQRKSRHRGVHPQCARLQQFAFFLELFTLARSDSTTDYRYDLGIRGSWRET